MSLALAASETDVSGGGEEVRVAAVFLQSFHPLDYVHQTSHTHLASVGEKTREGRNRREERGREERGERERKGRVEIGKKEREGLSSLRPDISSKSLKALRDIEFCLRSPNEWAQHYHIVYTHLLPNHPSHWAVTPQVHRAFGEHRHAHTHSGEPWFLLV